jgi:hypothetical protein
MSSKPVTAEVQLSEGLLDTIQSLAKDLKVSREDVLASSVKLMQGVAEGRFRVTKSNGATAREEGE